MSQPISKQAAIKDRIREERYRSGVFHEEVLYDSASSKRQDVV